MQPDDTSGLKALGAGSTQYSREIDPSILETFPNRTPEQRYEVFLECIEFTSLCPKTGQPDFGEIVIRYIPKDKCIESKSLKLYLGSFRQSGMFMESIVNQIIKDLFSVCPCHFMEVVGKFASRGGIKIEVKSRMIEHERGDG